MEPNVPQPSQPPVAGPVSVAPAPNVTPVAGGAPEPKKPHASAMKWLLWVGGVALGIVLIGTIVAVVYGYLHKNQKPEASAFDMTACVAEHKEDGEDAKTAQASCVLVRDNQQLLADQSYTGDPNSTDPIKKGKALSGGKCAGAGSKKLGSAPMQASDISIVAPYGLLAGGHVTPVDHQYYWGKVQMGDPDTYDVLAPADGRIVQVSYRDHSGQGKVKGDYRVVIAYSCTFFSYFDLATSLTPDIQKQLPKDWEKSKNPTVNTKIAVKQGQAIAKMGGQSLDYAVWDTTKQTKDLLVREAYNVAEPWKVVTVDPLDYYTATVKEQILPLYGRTVQPRDGVIGQDIDGRQVGNWFLEGTYGYAGYAQYTNQPDSYKGHLALVHNLFDPTMFMFSIGDYGGQPMQFTIKNPAIAPDTAAQSNGTVKYELASLSYVDGTGATWNMDRLVSKVTAVAGPTQGTALVRMLDTRKLKVEVFPGKTPAEVKDFTTAAKTYTRGDDAASSPTIQNSGKPTSTATP